MSVKDLDLTVVGWVGTNPKLYAGDGRTVAYAQFRMGHTVRDLDRSTGELTDGLTSWFMVKSFRDLALNVAECIRQGDPVVVHGRLRIEEYLDAEDQLKRTAVVVADAIGPDLRWGTSRFTRTVRPVPATAEDAAAGVTEPVPLRPGAESAQEDPDLPELPLAAGG